VILRIAKGVLFQEVDGEAVLLSVDDGTYFGLNEVGTLAWKYLIGTGSLDDAFRGILEEYEVDEATLRTDLEAFAEELVSSGLAHIVDSEP